ncbi:hypothetical protein DFJ73DRAFT_960627, partial [Zopfochytrium polystomum]
MLRSGRQAAQANDGDDDGERGRGLLQSHPAAAKDSTGSSSSTSSSSSVTLDGEKDPRSSSSSSSSSSSASSSGASSSFSSSLSSSSSASYLNPLRPPPPTHFPAQLAQPPPPTELAASWPLPPVFAPAMRPPLFGGLPPPSLPPSSSSGPAPPFGYQQMHFPSHFQQFHPQHQLQHQQQMITAMGLLPMYAPETAPSDPSQTFQSSFVQQMQAPLHQFQSQPQESPLGVEDGLGVGGRGTVGGGGIDGLNSATMGGGGGGSSSSFADMGALPNFGFGTLPRNRASAPPAPLASSSSSSSSSSLEASPFCPPDFNIIPPTLPRRGGSMSDAVDVVGRGGPGFLGLGVVSTAAAASGTMTRHLNVPRRRRDRSGSRPPESPSSSIGLSDLELSGGEDDGYLSGSSSAYSIQQISSPLIHAIPSPSSSPMMSVEEMQSQFFADFPAALLAASSPFAASAAAAAAATAASGHNAAITATPSIDRFATMSDEDLEAILLRSMSDAGPIVLQQKQPQHQQHHPVGASSTKAAPPGFRLPLALSTSPSDATLITSLPPSPLMSTAPSSSSAGSSSVYSSSSSLNSSASSAQPSAASRLTMEELQRQNEMLMRQNQELLAASRLWAASQQHQQKPSTASGPLHPNPKATGKQHGSADSGSSLILGRASGKAREANTEAEPWLAQQGVIKLEPESLDVDVDVIEDDDAGDGKLSGKENAAKPMLYL